MGVWLYTILENIYFVSNVAVTHLVEFYNNLHRLLFNTFTRRYR